MTKNQEIEITKAISQERGRLFQFIRNRVKSTVDAEDILQDVFYQFVRVSGEVNTIERISSWLYQVARNRITDLYRKKKNVAFSDIPSVIQEDEALNLFENLIPDINDLQDNQVTKNEIWEVLEEGLAELPFEQSQVFEMHELDGLSFSEIEEILDVSVNTLLSRKRYAVVYLRNKLNTLYNELLEK